MKKLLSVLVAALFAAVSANAVAQSKDVKSKEGDAVKSKEGNVTTKAQKETPKSGPVPKMEKRAKAEKAAPADVKTKDGGAVKAKDTKGVNK